jgi:hypothetical protein
MVERVKEWRREGRDVRIFTARITGEDIYKVVEQHVLINDWCREHLGEVLPVTATKDLWMIVLYDDRCRQVITNTGRLACPVQEYMPIPRPPEDL